MIVSEGTVYPLLSRLKALGLVKSEWVESDAGHPRKYYALTPAGKKRVQDMAGIWKRFSSSMSKLLAPMGRGRKVIMAPDAPHKDDAREIIEQLRSHIRDKAAASGEAALLGGRIWVESAIGQGSSFDFTARLGNPLELSGASNEAASQCASALS